MTREMTPAMSTALQAPVLRPVLIGYLDILSDPISMWTGAGFFQPSGSPDEILNGKTFFPDQSFADVSDIKEDQGIGGPVSIILKANNLDEDAMRQFVRDKRQWRGRNAYLWMGLFNEAMNAVLEYPVRIKTGIMTRVVINRTDTEVALELTVDVDLQNAKASPFRWTDHPRIFEDDTFSSFVGKLANKPSGLERPNSATRPGGWDSAYDRDQAWQKL